MSYRRTDETTATASYSTDVLMDQAMCDLWPTITVQLIETITTTTRHADGSTTVHETQPKVVQSWTHKHEETR